VEAVRAAGDLDPAAAHDLVTRGGAWVGRYRVQEPAYSVAEGEELTLHFPPLGMRPAAIGAGDVLYEDDTLLVLNKQPGVYVTMTPWEATGDVLWAARNFLHARDGRQYPLHLGHRLDRDTSGVLVITKDAAANAPLQKLFLEQAVDKRYLALAQGLPEWNHREIRTGHARSQHGLFRIYPTEQIGVRLGHGRQVVKAMETEFVVLQRLEEASLIEARPLTGRTHQIRMHLAHLGYPVAGDTRYGGAPELAGKPLAHHLLHAEKLDLPHPTRGGRLTLVAPLPPLFAEMLRELRDT
jgi:23S rRNA pseudouridine1911/1915/1917 synthase